MAAIMSTTAAMGIALPTRTSSLNAGRRVSRAPLIKNRGKSVRLSRTAHVVKANQNEPRKAITRDTEPEQYWMSESEREGKSPFEDPMAIAALMGLIVPFTILAVAIGSGYIEMQ